ncbi:proximal sequence element A Pbp49 [Augochlora pura]
MDDVYKVYNIAASPIINLKDYFDKYHNLIGSTENVLPIKQNDSNLMTLMGVELSEEKMSILTNYCSTDNLTIEGEVPKFKDNRKLRKKEIFGPQEPPDVDLQTIQNLKERLKDRKKQPGCKYQSEIFIHHEKDKERSRKTALPGQDILVFVRTYHPFAQRIKNPTKQCATTLRLNNIIAVLGSQTLAHLRDKISCITDNTISKETSDDLENAIGPMAKDVYKSGFFFIEDTFYNDTRCPENIDYSKVIIEWAQRRPSLGPFKTAKMEECRIDSLFLRFGFPWVYKHQGECEHLIVFSDARLINNDDNLNVSAYPQIVRLRPSSTKYCMMCSAFSAQWITLEHDRIPHNPCYFCDDCFHSYNYIDGEKVGNFKAFAYPRNIENMKGEK